MEGALASAATGALQSVVEKLTSLLGEEYRRLKGIRSKIEGLTCELKAMKAFLVNMSKAEDSHDEQDKLWVKDVRELSYDIEDSLDEFFTQHAAKPDGFMEKIRSLLERTKSRRRIAKEIQDLKTKVIEVAERNKRYSAGDHPHPAVHPSTVDPRALVIFEDARKLVGIDGPKCEIIRLLEEQEEEQTAQHGSPTQQQPKIVSIVGSGGLGKTTLAYQVYEQLKNQIQCRTFVSVSRNPDINGVLRKILYEVVRPEDINGDYVSTVAGTEQLIAMIREYLEREKKYLEREKRYYLISFL